MKYNDGTTVQTGDVAIVRRDRASIEGQVLKIILPNTEAANHWSLPIGGVLIEGGGLGLFTTESLENVEDIVFDRRLSS